MSEQSTSHDITETFGEKGVRIGSSVGSIRGDSSCPEEKEEEEKNKQNNVPTGVPTGSGATASASSSSTAAVSRPPHLHLLIGGGLGEGNQRSTSASVSATRTHHVHVHVSILSSDNTSGNTSVHSPDNIVPVHLRARDNHAENINSSSQLRLPPVAYRHHERVDQLNENNDTNSHKNHLLTNDHDDDCMVCLDEARKSIPNTLLLQSSSSSSASFFRNSGALSRKSLGDHEKSGGGSSTTRSVRAVELKSNKMPSAADRRSSSKLSGVDTNRVCETHAELAEQDMPRSSGVRRDLQKEREARDVDNAVAAVETKGTSKNNDRSNGSGDFRKSSFRSAPLEHPQKEVDTVVEGVNGLSFAPTVGKAGIREPTELFVEKHQDNEEKEAKGEQLQRNEARSRGEKRTVSSTCTTQLSQSSSSSEIEKSFQNEEERGNSSDFSATNTTTLEQKAAVLGNDNVVVVGDRFMRPSSNHFRIVAGKWWQEFNSSFMRTEEDEERGRREKSEGRGFELQKKDSDRAETSRGQSTCIEEYDDSRPHDLPQRDFDQYADFVHEKVMSYFNASNHLQPPSNDEKEEEPKQREVVYSNDATLRSNDDQPIVHHLGKSDISYGDPLPRCLVNSHGEFSFPFSPNGAEEDPRLFALCVLLETAHFDEKDLSSRYLLSGRGGDEEISSQNKPVDMFLRHVSNQIIATFGSIIAEGIADIFERSEPLVHQLRSSYERMRCCASDFASALVHGKEDECDARNRRTISYFDGSNDEMSSSGSAAAQASIGKVEEEERDPHKCSSSGLREPATPRLLNSTPPPSRKKKKRIIERKTNSPDGQAPRLFLHRECGTATIAGAWSDGSCGGGENSNSYGGVSQQILPFDIDNWPSSSNPHHNKNASDAPPEHSSSTALLPEMRSVNEDISAEESQFRAPIGNGGDNDQLKVVVSSEYMHVSHTTHEEGHEPMDEHGKEIEKAGPEENDNADVVGFQNEELALVCAAVDLVFGCSHQTEQPESPIAASSRPHNSNRENKSKNRPIDSNTTMGIHSSGSTNDIRCSGSGWLWTVLRGDMSYVYKHVVPPPLNWRKILLDRLEETSAEAHLINRGAEVKELEGEDVSKEMTTIRSEQREQSEMVTAEVQVGSAHEHIGLPPLEIIQITPSPLGQEDDNVNHDERRSSLHVGNLDESPPLFPPIDETPTEDDGEKEKFHIRGAEFSSSRGPTGNICAQCVTDSLLTIGELDLSPITGTGSEEERDGGEETRHRKKAQSEENKHKKNKEKGGLVSTISRALSPKTVAAPQCPDLSSHLPQPPTSMTNHRGKDIRQNERYPPNVCFAMTGVIGYSGKKLVRNEAKFDLKSASTRRQQVCGEEVDEQREEETALDDVTVQPITSANRNDVHGLDPHLDTTAMSSAPLLEDGDEHENGEDDIPDVNEEGNNEEEVRRPEPPQRAPPLREGDDSFLGRNSTVSQTMADTVNRNIFNNNNDINNTAVRDPPTGASVGGDKAHSSNDMSRAATGAAASSLSPRSPSSANPARRLSTEKIYSFFFSEIQQNGAPRFCRNIDHSNSRLVVPNNRRRPKRTREESNNDWTGTNSTDNHREIRSRAEGASGRRESNEEHPAHVPDVLTNDRISSFVEIEPQEAGTAIFYESMAPQRAIASRSYMGGAREGREINAERDVDTNGPTNVEGQRHKSSSHDENESQNTMEINVCERHVRGTETVGASKATEGARRLFAFETRTSSLTESLIAEITSSQTAAPSKSVSSRLVNSNLESDREKRMSGRRVGREAFGKKQSSSPLNEKRSSSSASFGGKKVVAVKRRRQNIKRIGERGRESCRLVSLVTTALSQALRSTIGTPLSLHESFSHTPAQQQHVASNTTASSLPIIPLSFTAPPLPLLMVTTTNTENRSKMERNEAKSNSTPEEQHSSNAPSLHVSAGTIVTGERCEDDDLTVVSTGPRKESAVSSSSSSSAVVRVLSSSSSSASSRPSFSTSVTTARSHAVDRYPNNQVCETNGFNHPNQHRERHKGDLFLLCSGARFCSSSQKINPSSSSRVPASNSHSTRTSDSNDASKVTASTSVTAHSSQNRKPSSSSSSSSSPSKVSTSKASSSHSVAAPSLSSVATSRLFSQLLQANEETSGADRSLELPKTATAANAHEENCDNNDNSNSNTFEILLRRSSTADRQRASGAFSVRSGQTHFAPRATILHHQELLQLPQQKVSSVLPLNSSRLHSTNASPRPSISFHGNAEPQGVRAQIQKDVLQAKGVGVLHGKGKGSCLLCTDCCHSAFFRNRYGGDKRLRETLPAGPHDRQSHRYYQFTAAARASEARSRRRQEKTSVCINTTTVAEIPSASVVGLSQQSCPSLNSATVVISQAVDGSQKETSETLHVADETTASHGELQPPEETLRSEIRGRSHERKRISLRRCTDQRGRREGISKRSESFSEKMRGVKKYAKDTEEKAEDANRVENGLASETRSEKRARRENYGKKAEMMQRRASFSSSSLSYLSSAVRMAIWRHYSPLRHQHFASRSRRNPSWVCPIGVHSEEEKSGDFVQRGRAAEGEDTAQRTPDQSQLLLTVEPEELSRIVQSCVQNELRRHSEELQEWVRACWAEMRANCVETMAEALSTVGAIVSAYDQQQQQGNRLRGNEGK